MEVNKSWDGEKKGENNEPDHQEETLKNPGGVQFTWVIIAERLPPLLKPW